MKFGEWRSSGNGKGDIHLVGMIPVSVSLKSSAAYDATYFRESFVSVACLIGSIECENTKQATSGAGRLSASVRIEESKMVLHLQFTPPLAQLAPLPEE